MCKNATVLRTAGLITLLLIIINNNNIINIESCPPKAHTHTHTQTTGFELNEFRAFSTAVCTSLKEEVNVENAGSVIVSECLVGLDPEVVCEVRLKSRIQQYILCYDPVYVVCVVYVMCDDVFKATGTLNFPLGINESIYHLSIYLLLCKENVFTC